MTCSKCQKEVSENLKFCTNCGNPVQSSSSKIGSDNSMENSSSSKTLSSDNQSVAHEEVRAKEIEKVAYEKKIQEEKLEAENAANRKIQTEKFKKQLENSTKEIELLQLKIDKIDVSIRTLNDWIDRNRSSVSAMIVTKVKSDIDEVNSILRNSEIEMLNLQIPEKGIMHGLRNQFLKRLNRTWGTLSLLAGLLLYLPHFGYLRIRVGIQWIYNVLGLSTLKIVLYLCTLLLFTTASYLLSYYRGWSQLERSVSTTSWRLKRIAAETEELRAEERRLSDVLPQLIDWLELIGRSLHHSWSISEDWLATSGITIDRESLPFSLRLAQAMEDEGPELIAMERFAAERYMIRGWRSKLFDTQIDAVREELGFAANRFNVEQLDSDVSYSPNGPRALVLSKINEDKVLRRVGIHELMPLIHEVQIEVVEKVRPPVIEARDNPFENFKRTEIDHDQLKTQEWDAFFLSLLQDSVRPRTPLSRAGFTDTGLASGRHDQVKTYIISPERFAENASFVQDIEFKGYSSTSKLAMEIVVRHDQVGPVLKSDLNIFQIDTVTSEFEKPKITRATLDSTDDGI